MSISTVEEIIDRIFTENASAIAIFKHTDPRNKGKLDAVPYNCVGVRRRILFHTHKYVGKFDRNMQKDYVRITLQRAVFQQYEDNRWDK